MLRSVPAPQANANPLAIGGTPGSDPYEIPNALAELTPREEGWCPESIGRGMPLATIAAGVRLVQVLRDDFSHGCRPGSPRISPL